jgi:hypothetical protein
MDTINELKVSEQINNKEKDAQEEALKKSAVLKTQVPAFKLKYPQYNLYRTQKKKLPPIKKEKEEVPPENADGEEGGEEQGEENKDNNQEGQQ